MASANLAFALPTDSKQPIHISADSAEISEPKGVATYTGNVELEQGSLHVTADKLTIHTKNGEVTLITAAGKRARFHQQPEVDAAPVQGGARSISYFTNEQKVVLEGDAELKQAEDSFRGERIEYDIATKVVNAAGAETSSRVETVVHPRSSDND